MIFLLLLKFWLDVVEIISSFFIRLIILFEYFCFGSIILFSFSILSILLGLDSVIKLFNSNLFDDINCLRFNFSKIYLFFNFLFSAVDKSSNFSLVFLLIALLLFNCIKLFLFTFINSFNCLSECNSKFILFIFLESLASVLNNSLLSLIFISGIITLLFASVLIISG